MICGSLLRCLSLPFYRWLLVNLTRLDLMGLSLIGPSCRAAASSRRIDCFQSLVWSAKSSLKLSWSVARKSENRISSTWSWVRKTILWAFWEGQVYIQQVCSRLISIYCAPATKIWRCDYAYLLNLPIALFCDGMFQCVLMVCRLVSSAMVFEVVYALCVSLFPSVLNTSYRFYPWVFL